jgi:signal peptidase I
MSYTFILTESMTGELDRGSLVVLRRSSQYQVGDIAGYRLYLEDDRYIIIVHRIVKVLPDGRFIFKGDANRGTETVDSNKIIGKLAMGITGLGFIFGAIKSAPMLIGGVLLIPMFFSGSKNPTTAPEGPGSDKPEARGKGLFLPTLVAVAFTLPFYSVGLAEKLGTLEASALILGFLGGARLMEVMDPWPEYRFLVDLMYGSVIALSMFMVSIPDALTSLRVMIDEF